MARGTTVEFDFVLMGEVLAPMPGVVAVDVGSRCEAGVIDHHFASQEVGEECAASLLVAHPEFVLEHARELGGTVTIRMHREPDFDCVASAFLVKALLETGRLPPVAPTLAAYAREVDAGRPIPGGIGEESVWALFVAGMQLADTAEARQMPEEQRFGKWVSRGLELLSCAVPAGSAAPTVLTVPRTVAGWDAERRFLVNERARYERDQATGIELRLKLPTPSGGAVRARGLRVRDPRSALFKHFARADGYLLTHVIWSGAAPAPAADSDRHVISVAPGRGVWLKGLGCWLESREVTVRAGRGMGRPGPPRWPDVDNADPWYDGRSPVHAYTIVDTPRNGTVLTTEEVCGAVVDTERWIPIGQHSRVRLCPDGDSQPDETGDDYCRKHGKQLIPAVVGGRYRVAGYLGEGTMGIVYKVLSLLDQRSLALKMMRRQQTEEEWKSRHRFEVNCFRFLREAYALAKVCHENVVRFVDAAADPAVGLYLVYEFVPGVTLSKDIVRLTARGRSYPLARARSVNAQLLSGLDAVHAAGVLHRDVKAANIMVAEDQGGDRDQPKATLYDFGLAIMSDPRETRLTACGLAAGTPAYASPEQLFDRPVDQRSDVYAAGSVLFELLCGEPPFADVAGPPAQVAVAKDSRPARRVRALRKELSDTALDAAVAALLERRPEDRPPSAAAARQLVEAAFQALPPALLSPRTPLPLPTP